MEYAKFEGKYIPNFESEELLQAAVFTKALTDRPLCLYCGCQDIRCTSCILSDRALCTAYLKQHHEHIENYLKELGKTSKEKGEETMENDLPKIKPGMVIAFVDSSRLGFMVSETQIMYLYPNDARSVIIDGWDNFGDQPYDIPYSRIKAVYASADTNNKTEGLIIKTLIPRMLASMVEAANNDEDLADLEGVRLVWRREHKEMTVEDIEKALGYKIKIIKGEK